MIILDHNQNLENNKRIAKVDGNVNKMEENKLQTALQHLTNLPQYYVDHGTVLLTLGLICTLKVLKTLQRFRYWLDSFTNWDSGKSNNQNDSVKIE